MYQLMQVATQRKDVMLYEWKNMVDYYMMLGLLDTDACAKEFLNINLDDIELATGSIMIRQGKGRKPRMVFLGAQDHSRDPCLSSCQA